MYKPFSDLSFNHEPILNLVYYLVIDHINVELAIPKSTKRRSKISGITIFKIK